MREDQKVAEGHTAKTEEQQRAGWRQLFEIVLQVHETDGSIQLDLPANKYEEILNLVEHERESCGPLLDLTLGRREDLIVLTATTDHVDGTAEIASIMGIDRPSS